MKKIVPEIEIDQLGSIEPHNIVYHISDILCTNYCTSLTLDELYKLSIILSAHNSGQIDLTNIYKFDIMQRYREEFYSRRELFLVIR